MHTKCLSQSVAQPPSAIRIRPRGRGRPRHTSGFGIGSKRILIWVVVILCPGPAFGGETPAAPVPLSQAHSHNDYHHARPLQDALSHGFCSVEADIFLVDGKLLVGHARPELSAEKTLERLYLDPLRARIEKNNGRVYPAGPPFLLWIDIKTEGEATYRALAKVLAGYSGILSEVVDGKTTPRAVTVVISGNRPWRVVQAESTRYAGVDGRVNDLGSNRPSHLMPWISDNWFTVFRWQGKGAIGADERKKLREIVEKAHAAGRRVRFWATPENPVVWEELLASGVDLINTDDLAGLQSFLLKRRDVTESGDLTYVDAQGLPDPKIDGQTTRIHTQGLLVTDRHFYVTGRLEGASRKSLLLRFDRSDPNKAEHLDITMSSNDGHRLDHPGGFDSDGGSLWIPVSQSRPSSTTVVLKFPNSPDRPLSALKGEEAFRVDDHIGAVAYDPATQQLFGANWDTQLIYVWKTDGTLVAKLSQADIQPPSEARAFAVQDWKGTKQGRIVAGAIDSSRQRKPQQSRSVLWLLDAKTRRETGVVRLPPPPDRDIELTREAVAALGDEIFFLPADLGDRATVYRYRWTRPK